jgi:hypothetical protein
MLITIKHNFPAVQQSLERLREGVRERALASAVNKTLAKARTAMSREIRAEFNLPASTVRDSLHIRRANFRAGVFSITGALESRDPRGRYRSLNVIHFAARQTRHGLTVKIKRKGPRKKIAGAFIANKGRTVFERVAGTTMQSRAQSKGAQHREQIKPVQTINVQQMFNTRRINAKVVQMIRDEFPAIVMREARFYTDRFNRASR